MTDPDAIGASSDVWSNINCSRSSLPDVRAILQHEEEAAAGDAEADVPGDQQLGVGGTPATPSRPSAHPGGPTRVVGNLDFGMPWLYDSAKKNPKVKALGVDDLLAPDARPDLLLITNRLDDHCHVRTLTQLSARAPDLTVVTTPNARAVLASLPTPFRRVTYLEPGESTAVSPDVRVLATAGTLLGPPWERPENGYFLLMPAGADADDRNGLLYYEPHCLHDRSFLERKRVRADVVITPVVKQLPSPPPPPPRQLLHARLRAGGRRRPGRDAASEVRGPDEKRRPGRRRAPDHRAHRTGDDTVLPGVAVGGASPGTGP
ncbi:unnamed protein product [Miscanthus lutarioriparius]|uniref:Uncharacterized protein n=1 Tax=Miscanthus lutarioriparius TaxID=422564 RepID=A0A811PIY1_9POAL|nr:unnamed protein product [Miscanthus lutarioriparius]